MPVRLGRTPAGNPLPLTTPPTIKGSDGKFRTGWGLVNHVEESNDPSVSELPEDFLKIYKGPPKDEC